MSRVPSVSTQQQSASEPGVGMNAPARKFTLVDEARLRERVGRGYGRIGKQKSIRRQTGLGKTASHNRVSGLTVPTVVELAKIGAAADPRLNAFFPVGEVVAEIVGARFQLPTEQLVVSLVHRLQEEQSSDGLEDVTQGDARAVLALLGAKGRALTEAERRAAHEALLAHRDALLRHLPAVLAVLGDLEALLPRLEVAH